ncbi:MAG: hypothetical protein F4Z96_05195 [Chloroflexi bacterium]|nr:hypothetical protein [Chloroflexota bacterium]
MLDFLMWSILGIAALIAVIRDLIKGVTAATKAAPKVRENSALAWRSLRQFDVRSEQCWRTVTNRASWAGYAVALLLLAVLAGIIVVGDVTLLVRRPEFIVGFWGSLSFGIWANLVESRLDLAILRKDLNI